MAREIQRRGGVGVRDVVESYCAITVHFDPLRTDVDRLVSDLGEAMVDEERFSESDGDAPETGQRLVTVPVATGGVTVPTWGPWPSTSDARKPM